MARPSESASGSGLGGSGESLNFFFPTTPLADVAQAIAAATADTGLKRNGSTSSRSFVHAAAHRIGSSEQPQAVQSARSPPHFRSLLAQQLSQRLSLDEPLLESVDQLLQPNGGLSRQPSHSSSFSRPPRAAALRRDQAHTEHTDATELHPPSQSSLAAPHRRSSSLSSTALDLLAAHGVVDPLLEDAPEPPLSSAQRSHALLPKALADHTIAASQPPPQAMHAQPGHSLRHSPGYSGRTTSIAPTAATRASSVAPVKYASPAQSFYHNLLTTSSSELAAQQKHRHALLIHRPLTSLTHNTQIYHSIRFNGVDMTAEPDQKEQEEQEVEHSIADKESALDNATTFNRLSGLLSGASLEESGSSLSARSHPSATGTSSLPALHSHMKSATARAAIAAAATSASAAKHARDGSVNSELLLALRRHHAAPFSAAVSMASLRDDDGTSNLPRSRPLVANSVGITLDDAAMSAARRLLHDTLAAAPQPEHKSAIRAPRGVGGPIQPPQAVRPKHGRRAGAALAPASRKALHDFSLAAAGPIMPPPPIAVKVKTSRRAATLATAATAARTATKAASTAVTEENDSSLASTAAEPALPTPTATSSVPPLATSIPIAVAPLPASSSPPSAPPAASKLPPEAPSASTATSHPSTSTLTPIFISVLAPETSAVAAPLAPSGAPGSLHHGSLAGVAVHGPAPTPSPRALRPQVPRLAIPATPSRSGLLTPSTPSSTTSAASTAAREHYQALFFPPPVVGGVSAAASNVPAMISSAVTPRALESMPVLETAGSITFRRPPDEQAEYMRRLEQDVSREADSTLNAVHRSAHGLTSAALHATTLRKNEATSHARLCARQVDSTSRTLLDAVLQAQVQADVNWAEEKSVLDLEHAQHSAALTARLGQLAARMQAQSEAAWNASLEAREMSERNDLENMATETRAAELMALEAALASRRAKAQQRWNAEWAEARRAKEAARLQAERDALIKAVELEAFARAEYEKKRMQARAGVLWVRVIKADDLGEENFAFNASSTSASLAPGSRSISRAASVSGSPAPGHRVLSSPIEMDPDSRRSTVLPKGTSTCISVQLRFKAASLSSAVVHTRYFGRITSPVIGECFRLPVANAYLQTVCIVVHTAPQKQVDTWEREVRAALAMHQMEREQLERQQAPGLLATVPPVGELVRTGALVVRHAVHKDPVQLVGPAATGKPPRSTRQHLKYVSISGPAAGHTTSALSSTLGTISDVAEDAEVEEVLSDASAGASRAASKHASRAVSPSPLPHAPSSSASLKASPQRGRRVSVSVSSGGHLSLSREVGPVGPSSVASSGLGAGSSLFLGLDAHAAIAARLRPRDEVISRVEEFGRVEIPLSSIRSLPHGRMARALGLTRTLTEAQKKERDLRRHAARRAAHAAQAVNTANAAATMAMVATGAFKPAQHHLAQLHLQGLADLSTATPTTASPDLSPPLSPSPATPRTVAAKQPTPAASPRHLGLDAPSTAAAPSPPPRKALPRLDRVEVVQCGSVTLEFLLLPLFSRATAAADAFGPGVAIGPAAAPRAIRIGASTLRVEEQRAVEARLEREAEAKTHTEEMPDMAWVDDPNWRAEPSQAEEELARALQAQADADKAKQQVQQHTQPQEGPPTF